MLKLLRRKLLRNVPCLKFMLFCWCASLPCSRTSLCLLQSIYACWEEGEKKTSAILSARKSSAVTQTRLKQLQINKRTNKQTTILNFFFLIPVLKMSCTFLSKNALRSKVELVNAGYCWLSCSWEYQLMCKALRACFFPLDTLWVFVL